MNRFFVKKRTSWPATRTYAISVLAMLLAACAQSPSRQQPKTVDDVLSGVPDPEMRAVWSAANAKGDLPPISEIPEPVNAVSQRQLTRVDAVPYEMTRPVIPKELVIAVQPFSRAAVSSYEGRFEVTEHTSGAIRGVLLDKDQPFEILYRLPEAKRATLAEQSTVMNLTFRETLVDNSLQRRMVLQDLRSNRASLVSISEGGQTPYRTEIKRLGLVIRQAEEGENPPVTVTYNQDSVTLSQGQSKKVGHGGHQLNVYLLNSYAQDVKHAFADPGQPYYVNIVIYSN